MSADNAPWFRDGLRFSCQAGCVRCCCGAPGDVSVTHEEIRRIAASLNMAVADFEAANTRHYSSGRKSLTERANGDCELLDGKGCSVYLARPQQCRDYPFWPEVMASPATWQSESRRCPGIGVGELHSAEAIQAMLESQSEPELSPETSNR